MTDITEIDKSISEKELQKKGLTVENIVGTLDLGREFDLPNLSVYLENAEYEPEASPFLVYRPQTEEGTVLIPTNGRISLVGCKKKEQMIQLATHVIEELSRIVTEELPSPTEVEVQNIVVRGGINHELKLPPIVALLGLEVTEYEPEQFPGIIYRPEYGTTALIFNSGKFMINGATSYSQASFSVDMLLEKFREGGVPMGV